jgi:chromosome segregation ATPase
MNESERSTHEGAQQALLSEVWAMTLERLVQQVEERLRNLGRQLLRPDPLAPLREQIAAAEEEVHQHQTALERCRDALAETRRRLTYNQTAAALLTSRIESYLTGGASDRAWKHALELDKLRQAAAEDQALLPKQEQAVWSLEFRLRQLERKLASLREQFAEW